MKFYRYLLSILLFFPALSVVALTTATPSAAYCAAPALEWPRSSVTTTETDGFPDWMPDLLRQSAESWNGIGGADWYIYYFPNSPISNVNVAMRYKKTNGMGRLPGYTNLAFTNGNITGGDVHLNPEWNWNNQGIMNDPNQRADVRTVTTHEWGHNVYLNHPFACGPMTSDEENAVMNPEFTQKRVPKPDDRDGVAYVK